MGFGGRRVRGAGGGAARPAAGGRRVRGACGRRSRRSGSRWSLFAAAVAAGATQPGAAVRSFVVRVLGGDRPPAPRARIGPLPPGKLLVTSQRGTWVVARDGSRRLLGAYTGATWSPHGLYVAAWSGADLSAVAPDGRVAWRLRTPGPVASAAWSPDGFRVAYRRAGGLGIVAGDGTGPRMLAAAVAPAGPAWRPGAPHTLAWVDAAGRVVVRDADSGALVWRSPGTVALPRGLAWSADGRLLLVPTAGGLLLADPLANRVRAPCACPAGDRAVAAAWAPRGRRLAVVARRPASDLSRVIVARGGVEIADRPVFETTGRLASPAWSPDGRRVLVRWVEADAWLCFRPRPPARRRWRSPRWRSGSAACRWCAAGAAPTGRSYAASGAVHRVGEPVVVVVGEHLRHELAAARHAGLLVHGLQVVLDGVAREVQLAGDLVRRQAARERARHVDLARRELVGLHDQRRDLARLRRLDHHRGVRRHPLGSVQARGVDEQPHAAARPGARARRGGRDARRRPGPRLLRGDPDLARDVDAEHGVGEAAHGLEVVEPREAPPGSPRRAGSRRRRSPCPGRGRRGSGPARR